MYQNGYCTVLSFTKREDESLGITIVGGKDKSSEGIFVKSITTSGLCGLDGSLRIGDQILELNGYNMLSVSHKEAVELFRECKTDIKMVVSRLLESKTTGNNLSQYHGQLVATWAEGASDMEPFLLEHKTLL